MRSILFILIITAVTAISGCKPMKEKITYPQANKDSIVDVYFGQEIADPYRWLEDDNSEATASWVKAENEITAAYLEKIPFRPALKSRLETIWNYPKLGVPFKRGGRYFYFKNDGLQNQSVLFMQENLGDEAVVLLDPNKFSEDGTIALGNVSPSKDGKYLAYSISRGGSDWNEIVVMDISTRELLTDTIKWVKFSGISWFQDGFFYSAYDAPEEGKALSGSNQFHKVYYHKLGSNQADDKLIFSDPQNPLRNFYAYLTEDQEYLMISESESTSGNALYVKKTNNMKANFVKIANGFDYEYSVIDHLGDQLLVVTNESAQKKQLVAIDPKKPESSNRIPAGCQLQSFLF